MNLGIPRAGRSRSTKKKKKTFKMAQKPDKRFSASIEMHDFILTKIYLSLLVDDKVKYQKSFRSEPRKSKYKIKSVLKNVQSVLVYQGVSSFK